MTVAKKKRVLVVDDSAFMRRVLTEIIESDPRYEVVGAAGDGVEALRVVEALQPDIITMDVELPELDGITCVAYIMHEFPTPIVMVSGFSSYTGVKTIEALELGAVGFVHKPKATAGRNVRAAIRDELLSQLAIAAQVDVRRLVPVGDRASIVNQPTTGKTAEKLVVIASSSGGPRALSQVIPKLPADLAAAVLVVQHMPADFIAPLAERLDRGSSLIVKVAEAGELLQHGRVLIAPGDAACRVVADPRGHQRLIELTMPSDGVLLCYSAANIVMESAALVYGRNATGVVLTGMGSDGTDGLRAIKNHGGHTIAEHESTCVVYGMPKTAIEAGVVDQVVALPDVAGAITNTVKGVPR